MAKPLIIVSIALLGAAGFAPISVAQAQMRASAMSPGFGRSISVSFTERPHPRWFGSSAIFLGDPFYADYRMDPLANAPPQIVIVPATATDAPPETKSEPLMIELQGNRYVRFGGRQQSAERGTSVPPDYAEANAGSFSSQPTTHTDLPPTVLIFRDGHREEVPEYAIVGSILYATGDYWQNGYWTKNIQLSALNIAATVRANHDNGVRFLLPSAPNEVVTRP
jgi:hypothetical protein